MYSFGFGVDAPAIPDVPAVTPALTAAQIRQTQRLEATQALQARQQAQMQNLQLELSRELPTISTASPQSMTDEQLATEYQSLSSFCGRYQHYFQNDQRVVAVCNRQKVIDQERNNRRMRTATFESFAMASPIGIAFGSGIAYLLGMSPARGAIIGGLATGMLPVLVISYLGSRRQ